MVYKEFITGNKFKHFADKHDWAVFVDSNSMGCEIRKLAKLDKPVVLITHNGQEPITDRLVKNLPDNVLKWFGIHVETQDDRVAPIPRGTRCKFYPVSKPNTIKLRPTTYSAMFHKAKLIELMQSPKNIKNTLYVNHYSKVNPKDRLLPYIIFNNKRWATLKHTNEYKIKLRDIRRHKFVICPEGMNMDTHQIWETLYLGSIPIVLESEFKKPWEDLPVLTVKRWSDVTPQLLSDAEAEIQCNSDSGAYKDIKMRFSYWANLILLHKP